MRYLIIAFCTIFLTLDVASQDFSNKGKEFWVGYGSHCSMYGTGGVVNATGGAQDMVLYFTSDKNATVTVDIPAIGWTRTYTVTANQVTTSALIPKAGSQDARITDEGKNNKGIHITSDVPIIAYAHVYNSSISGATLLFPVTTLGREYYSLNFTQVSNDVNGYCYAYVIATEDDTNIEIILSANSFNNNAGDTIKVNLNKGEIYNVFGRKVSSVGNTHTGTDLTGTRIRSVATATSACKKIAVFSGSGKLSITCAATSGSADNYMQQAFPSTAWGKKYLLAPTKDMPNNYYRIAVSKPGAIVKRNGVTLTGLVNGFYYQFFSNTPDLIESDEPVMVAQYISTANTCGNTKIGGNGDPEMIYLSPIEQTIEKVTINSTPNAKILIHYVNIIIPKGGFTSLTIDGVPVSIDSVTTHPGDNSYYYMQLWMKSGSHTIQSDSGFNAIAYGYGSAETYGYNAGCNVKDQYQELYTSNKLATVQKAATCIGTPFEVAITLPYEPLSIQWTVPNYPSIPKVNFPKYDSTWIKNGKTVYKYSLPGNYLYWTTGSYTIQVLVNNPTTDGCSGEQAIDFILDVQSRPKADFSLTTSHCINDSISLIDNSTSTGRPIVGFAWDMGDGKYKSDKSFNYKYQTSGTYTIGLYSYTDIGCVSDTVFKTVILDSIPVADFKILDSLCQNKNINLLDNSTAIGGSTILKRWWQSNDGMTALNLVSFGYSFKNIGPYSISLQVETANGCKSPITTKWLNIFPNPVVDFDLPKICLPDGKGSFLDKSTISDATESSFKRTWIFGDVMATPSNPDTVINNSNPSHSYFNVGPFNVKLIVTSDHGCIDSATKVLSTIYAQPKIDFDAQSELCLRKQSIFTDKTDAKGRTMSTWNWSFSDGTTSSNQNPQITFSNPTTYTATLFGFSSDGCVSDTVSKNVIIHPLPVADFTISNPLCENNQITFTQTSVANVGSIVRWNWTLGTGSISQNITNGSIPVAKTFAAWGDQTIKLAVENSKGCVSDTLEKVYHINPRPFVDFDLPKICLPDGNGQFLDKSSIVEGLKSGFSQKWVFGDPQATVANPNIVLNQTNPSHKYFNVGPFNVKLIVTSAMGCSDSATKILSTIYAQPKIDFSYTPELCLRQQSSFTDKTDAKGRTMVQWQWSFSNGSSSTVQNPNLTFITSATHTATLYGFTSDGCVSDTVTKSFIIHPLPTADFNLSSPLCETKQVSFLQNASANVGSITRWNWTLGSGSTPVNFTNAATAVTKTFATWGDQIIKLVVENSKGCIGDTLIRTYRIHPRPTIDFPLPEVCLNDAFAPFSAVYSIADKSIGEVYSWNFADPNATPGNPNTGQGSSISHKYSAAANYSVVLNVVTAAGCSNSITKSVTVNGATPNAIFDILNETGLCSNVDVSLKNMSVVDFGSVTKLEIFWDYDNDPTNVFTDDNPTLNKIYKHLYTNFQTPSLKTYTIRVRAYSGGVCFDDTLKTINLNGSPLVNFQSMPGICLEASPRQITQATFTDVTGIASGAELYTGSGVSNTGLFTPSISGAGSFPINYTFTSSNGCFISATQSITVWPRPTADFTVSATQCEKTPLTFTNKSIANAGNIVTWNWNFGDGTLPITANNGNALNHTYTSSGSFTSTLDVVTNNGCTSIPKNLIVSVNPLPIVKFDLPKVCLPSGRALFSNRTTIPNGSSMTYLWNFGDPLDPSASVSTDGLHYYKNYQTYNVKLTATSSQGCTDNLTQVLVDVFPQPKAGIKSVDSVCVGTAINFFDTSKGFVRPITQWYWNFADGSTETVKDPIYKHLNSGTFKISLSVISSEGCPSDTAYKTITIHPYPVVDAGPNMFVLDDGQKLISATATGSALTFKWTPTTYLSAGNILQPTIIFPQQDMVYTLTVSGRGGCIKSDNMAITVLKMPKPPNTFTPNGDGINDTWDIIYLDQYPGCIVEVYNTQGQVVFRTEEGYTKKWDGTYKGSPLPSGTYYYVIDPKNGRNKMAGYVTIFK